MRLWWWRSESLRLPPSSPFATLCNSISCSVPTFGCPSLHHHHNLCSVLCTSLHCTWSLNSMQRHTVDGWKQHWGAVQVPWPACLLWLVYCIHRDSVSLLWQMAGLTLSGFLDQVQMDYTPPTLQLVFSYLFYPGKGCIVCMCNGELWQFWVLIWNWILLNRELKCYPNITSCFGVELDLKKQGRGQIAN